MRYLVPTLFYVALTVYCLVDILYHRYERPHGLPKIAWVFLVVLVPYLAATTWIVLKFLRRPRARPTPGRLAPDDDPEYLRWLGEQERRRREQGES